MKYPDKVILKYIIRQHIIKGEIGMETINIEIKLKDNTNISITKEADEGFYGGSIWAEGFGLSQDFLHILENEIYIQNTRLGSTGEKIEITSLKMLLDEILFKDTEFSGCIYWSADRPWNDIEANDGTVIENIDQLINRIGTISNIRTLKAQQEFIDDDEYMASLFEEDADEPYKSSMNEIIDFSKYKGTL